MHILFVHQNFPAQFQHIAPRLVREFGWRCTFVTEKAEKSLPSVEKIVYKARGGATHANHLCTRNFENCVGQAHGVYDALKSRRDLNPDLIVAHTGFGSSLFLPYLWDAPIINFLEYFYHPTGQNLGYRPEEPITEAQLLRLKTRNAMILLDLENCERGWTPTHYQREFFPKAYQDKIEAIFDGIDTEIYYRKQNAGRQIGEGKSVEPQNRIVTYVARGFELMRGFDIFMKAAKRIYEQFPDVRFVVVGTDNIYYGSDLKYIQERSFRHHVLGQDEYDPSKFHFTGYVPQEALADILSISDLHIYLTEPFIASWSMVDAMACGAVVLASDQNCVREYITHGQNGLLFDFFDHEALARQAIEVLKDPPSFRHLGDAAQRTVQERYSLSVALPRLKDFFERVGVAKRSPSIRAELLVRKGIWQKSDDEDDDALGKTPARSNAPESRTTRVPIDSTVLPGPGTDDHSRAISLLKKTLAQSRTIQEWILATQDFRGPSPLYAKLGPPNHPTDLARLLKRVQERKARLVVNLGAGDGGMLLLLCQMAAVPATMIAAGLGQGFPVEKIPFFEAMAGERQRVRCIPNADGAEELRRQIDRLCDGEKIDVLLMDGLRPHQELRANFRHFRNRMHKKGIIAWSGINPLVVPDAEHDGGHRLWSEVKPMYPFHAEYLSGCNSLSGGIAAIQM